MEQGALVGDLIRGGRRLIDKLGVQGFPIRRAFWVKEGGAGWYLYLVTPLVTEDGATRPAYRRLNEAIGKLGSALLWVDPSDIKLIGPADPVAKAVEDAVRGHGTPTPLFLDSSSLGSLVAEEAYVYPNRRVFVFEFQRKGQTNRWEMISMSAVLAPPEEKWHDKECRVEEGRGLVTLRVYSEEALDECDAAYAQGIAEDAMKARHPGCAIDHPDADCEA